MEQHGTACRMTLHDTVWHAGFHAKVAMRLWRRTACATMCQAGSSVKEP